MNVVVVHKTVAHDGPVRGLDAHAGQPHIERLATLATRDIQMLPGQRFGRTSMPPVERVERAKMRKRRHDASVRQQKMPEPETRGAIFALRGKALHAQAFRLRAVARRQCLIDPPVECGRVVRRWRAGATAQEVCQQRKTETCKPVGGAR